jgi:hypothetical protein
MNADAVDERYLISLFPSSLPIHHMRFYCYGLLGVFTSQDHINLASKLLH